MALGFFQIERQFFCLSFKEHRSIVIPQDIRKSVQVKFHLNSRQANDAVYDAQVIISSQHELVKYHYTNALAKVEFTQKRINKAKSPTKKANLQKRLEKEQRKLNKWQKHIENHTFLKVICGGNTPSSGRTHCRRLKKHPKHQRELVAE